MFQPIKAIFGWTAPDEEDADEASAGRIAPHDWLEPWPVSINDELGLQSQAATRTPPPAKPSVTTPLSPTILAPKSDPADARIVDDAQSREHRLTARQRSLLGGKIVFCNGERSLDCIIRDQSKTGARVRLAWAEMVPETLYLLEYRRGVAFEAKVAWSRGRDVGLMFRAVHNLNEVALTPELSTMRQLWLARAPA